MESRSVGMSKVDPHFVNPTPQVGEFLSDFGFVDHIRTLPRQYSADYAPWHLLYFFPLPQGQGSFRPTFVATRLWDGGARSASGPRLVVAWRRRASDSRRPLPRL